MSAAAFVQCPIRNRLMLGQKLADGVCPQPHECAPEATTAPLSARQVENVPTEVLETRGRQNGSNANEETTR